MLVTQRGRGVRFWMVYFVKMYFFHFLQNSALLLAKQIWQQTVSLLKGVPKRPSLCMVWPSGGGSLMKAGSEASRCWSCWLRQAGRRRLALLLQYSKSKEEFSFTYRPDMHTLSVCSVLYFSFVSFLFWILSDWAAFFYDTSWLFLTLETYCRENVFSII